MKVAGIGFRADATLADLRSVLALTGARPDALASLAAKAAQPALIELAAELALPLFTPHTIPIWHRLRCRGLRPGGGPPRPRPGPVPPDHPQTYHRGWDGHRGPCRKT